MKASVSTPVGIAKLRLYCRAYVSILSPRSLTADKHINQQIKQHVLFAGYKKRHAVQELNISLRS